MLTHHEVVEDAFYRQREIHDFGEAHLEDGREKFHGRAAHVEIFHRRNADDRGVWAKWFSIWAKHFLLWQNFQSNAPQCSIKNWFVSLTRGQRPLFNGRAPVQSNPKRERARVWLIKSEFNR